MSATCRRSLAIVLGVLFAAAGSAQAVIMQGAGQNFVGFEAEAGLITANAGNKPWVVAGHGNASSGQILDNVGAAGGGATADANRVEYTIVFDAPGTYNIYARVLMPTTSNDSIFTSTALNAPAATTWFNGGAVTSLDWRQSQTVTVNPGQVGTPQVYAISGREGGSIVDRFVLSTTSGLNSAQLNALANSHDPLPTKYINPLTGKYYELTTGGTFAQGKAAAEALSFAGVQGHMAIVNDAQENRFLTGLLGPNAPNIVDGGWIGLTDSESFGGSESQGTANNRINGWVWTTPGGPVPLASTGFQNWNTGEPNDFNGNEDAAQLTDVNWSITGGVWNDISLTGTQGSTFVEYDNAPPTPGAQMRVVYSAGTPINSLAAADALLAGGIAASREANATVYAVNFQNFPRTAIDEGRFLGNSLFPGEATFTGTGDDNFAVQVTGFLFIPEAGQWTFGTNADDGTRLRIDGMDVIVDDVLSSPHDKLGIFNALTAGTYSFELTYFESGGGAELEFFAAQGAFTTFDPTSFRLVGDSLQGGLALALAAAAVPEPATAMLGLLALSTLARRRRRHA